MLAWQLVGHDYYLSLNFGEIKSGVPCPVWFSSSTAVTWTHCNKSGEGPQRCWRAWNVCLLRRGWELQLFSLERRLWGVLSMCVNSWWKGMKNSAALFSVALSRRVKVNRYDLKLRRFCLKMEKKHISFTNGWWNTGSFRSKTAFKGYFRKIAWLNNRIRRDASFKRWDRPKNESNKKVLSHFSESRNESNAYTNV